MAHKDRTQPSINSKFIKKKGCNPLISVLNIDVRNIIRTLSRNEGINVDYKKILYYIGTICICISLDVLIHRFVCIHDLCSLFHHMC